MIRRWLLRLSAGSTAVLVVALFTASGSAEVPTTVDVYGGNAHAAGVHSIYKTEAFTNFGSGAVDNRYPLAVVGQDTAPSSRATASNQDYGPLGATLAASGTPRVDYAVAQYPPTGAAKADAHCCDQAGGADAHARELTSNSSGVYSGSPNTGAAFNNATAESKTIVNPDGSLVITTHAHVSQASFGGDNGLVIKNVDVVTKLVSAGGRGRVSDTIAPGQATFAGQPVSITDQGVTVGGTTVPVGGVSAGTPVFRVFTVAPEKKEEGPNASILATGTHVVVSQPSAPGVPANTTEYILAEGQAEGFAIPSTASSSGSTSSAGGTSLSGSESGSSGSTEPFSTTTTSSGPDLSSLTSSTPGYTGGAPSNLIAQPKQTARRRLPTAYVAQLIGLPLAPFFFVWEALIFGTAAYFVWVRRQDLGEE